MVKRISTFLKRWISPILTIVGVGISFFYLWLGVIFIITSVIVGEIIKELYQKSEKAETLAVPLHGRLEEIKEIAFGDTEVSIFYVNLWSSIVSNYPNLPELWTRLWSCEQQRFESKFNKLLQNFKSARNKRDMQGLQDCFYLTCSLLRSYRSALDFFYNTFKERSQDESLTSWFTFIVEKFNRIVDNVRDDFGTLLRDRDKANISHFRQAI